MARFLIGIGPVPGRKKLGLTCLDKEKNETEVLALFVSKDCADRFYEVIKLLEATPHKEKTQCY